MADERARFYADADWSFPLAELMRQHGADVLTAQDDGRAFQPDPVVMDRATALGRALLSHDQDMLAEARRRQREGRHSSGLIRVRQKDQRRALVREDLVLIAELGQSSEFADQVTYVPL